MSLNLESFTDKAQQTIAAALQLAKDYSHAQCTSTSSMSQLYNDH